MLFGKTLLLIKLRVNTKILLIYSCFVIKDIWFFDRFYNTKIHFSCIFLRKLVLTEFKTVITWYCVVLRVKSLVYFSQERSSHIIHSLTFLFKNFFFQEISKFYIHFSDFSLFTLHTYIHMYIYPILERDLLQISGRHPYHK